MKGVRQGKVSDVSGPKCGAGVHKGLGAWEQERGKNRNATPKTAFGPDTSKQSRIFKKLQKFLFQNHDDEGDHDLREDDEENI